MSRAHRSERFCVWRLTDNESAVAAIRDGGGNIWVGLEPDIDIRQIGKVIGLRVHVEEVALGAVEDDTTVHSPAVSSF